MQEPPTRVGVKSVRARMRRTAVFAGVSGVLALSGCEAVRQHHFSQILGTGEQAVLADSDQGVKTAPRSGSVTPPFPSTGPPSGSRSRTRRGPEYIQRGTDRYVADAAAAEAVGAGDDSGLKLNFENTSILNVVNVVIKEMLGESYVVDPAVQGTVTLQTTRPIQRDELLPTLELMLRMNGAAVVWRDGLYHIVPTDAAIQGLVVPQLGNSKSAIPSGYAVRVIPLRYVSAAQMQEILEPFTSPGNVVRVDDARNLIIVAGTGQELEIIEDTVDVFDVDWMAGQSIAMFTPRFVDAKTLADEVNAIMGDPANTALAGLVRLVPIERLDALLVISPRRAYVERVGRWITRLDRDTGATGQRLFVYHVQNGKAADLAKVLNDVFSGSEEDFIRPAEVAPGLQGASVQSAVNRFRDDEQGDGQDASASDVPVPLVDGTAGGSGGGLSISSVAGVRVIADEINNALLIMATSQQFRQVESALRDLDIAPLQVLIEATIAEVSLTGELSQGLEWFFKNHLGGGNTGTGTLDLGAAGLQALVPGFSYAVTEATTVKAVLNILAQDSRANIVSSPSLMVLNNQQATIQVGDQVPITTQQQQSTASNSNVVNNIEFRDTGVLLTVTPRVNAGGLVIMDVEQEVSNVAPGDTTTLTPTIQQRRISSTVAVHSAETVVLGGLIRENKSEIASGIPGLYSLPIVGPLFGTQTDQANRTELVVLITPRAVQGIHDARDVTEEFRRKMESLQPLTPKERPLQKLKRISQAEPTTQSDAPAKPVSSSNTPTPAVPAETTDEPGATAKQPVAATTSPEIEQTPSESGETKPATEDSSVQRPEPKVSPQVPEQTPPQTPPEPPSEWQELSDRVTASAAGSPAHY